MHADFQTETHTKSHSQNPLKRSYAAGDTCFPGTNSIACKKGLLPLSPEAKQRVLTLLPGLGLEPSDNSLGLDFMSLFLTVRGLQSCQPSDNSLGLDFMSLSSPSGGFRVVRPGQAFQQVNCCCSELWAKCFFLKHSQLSLL